MHTRLLAPEFLCIPYQEFSCNLERTVDLLPLKHGSDVLTFHRIQSICASTINHSSFDCLMIEKVMSGSRIEAPNMLSEVYTHFENRGVQEMVHYVVSTA